MKILIAKKIKLKEDSMTRWHKAMLVRPYCRVDKIKFSSQRTLNDWNQLSYDCVNASIVSMFKTLTIIWQGQDIPRLNT